MTALSIRNMNHTVGERELSSGTKLTPEEERDLQIAVAITGRHNELGWVAYYEKRGDMKAAERSLAMAWKWHKRFCELVQS